MSTSNDNPDDIIQPIIIDASPGADSIVRGLSISGTGEQSLVISGSIGHGDEVIVSSDDRYRAVIAEG